MMIRITRLWLLCMVLPWACTAHEEAGNPRNGETELHGDPLPPGALARIGMARLRHGAGVTAVDFSPDGKTLASASRDGALLLWDAATGRELRRLSGQVKGIFSICFFPDGKRLASGGSDNTVRVWNLESGKELFHMAGHGDYVGSVSVAPNGESLASASKDGTVRIWSASTGKLVRQIKAHDGDAACVAYAPNGHVLASASAGYQQQDHSIRLWDAATGEKLRTLEGHLEGVLRIAFSPDGKILASGSFDKTVRLWDVSTGKELAVLRGHDRNVLSLAFSPDGRSVASGSWDKTIRLWEVVTGQEQQRLLGHTEGIFGLAFSQDGRSLASGGDDRTVRIWDVVAGEERVKAHKPLSKPKDNGDRSILAVAFSPDGKRLSTGQAGREVCVYDAATRQQLLNFPGHEDSVAWVAFDPGGQLLASMSSRRILLWDSATGEKTLMLSPTGEKGRGGHRFLSCALSPDSRTLAVGDDAGINLWETGSGKRIAELRGHESGVATVAFAPDGKVLVSGSYDKTVCLWDVSSRKQLVQLKGHAAQVFSVAFSPDGRLVASGSAGPVGGYAGTEIRLWEVSSGEEVAAFPPYQGHVRGLAFSPDGRSLASASDDGLVHLWSVRSEKELGIFRANDGFACSVAFSPDGRTLVSGHQGGTTVFWDLKTFKEPVSEQPLSDVFTQNEKGLWASLDSADAREAQRTMQRLAAGGERAVPLLRTALQKPPEPLEAERVQQFLMRLNHDFASVRETAAKELAQLGAAADAGLRQSLQNNVTAEGRTRIEAYFASRPSRCAGIPSGRLLGTLRALQVLEEIGTKEAREVLDAMETAWPASYEKSEAQAAAARIRLRESKH